MSINEAFALFAAFVLLSFGVVTVARAAPWWWRQRRVRRNGRTVVGEVTALDPKYRAYYGLYQLTPVVRYEIDGRAHEARVANLSGATTIGTTVDLRVLANDPDTPFAVYGQSITQTIAVGFGFAAFALLMGVWATRW